MTSNWPALNAQRDGPTIATLHLASQMIGKAAVALLPWRNHGWHLTLRLHPRGLRTEPLHGAGGTFELGLDLVDHALVLEDAGGHRSLSLGDAANAAELHAGFLRLLSDAGHRLRPHAVPNEIEPAIPFARDDTPRGYERDSAGRLLQALLSADRVLRLFRSGFLGKASPVHFFWGSFDLAVTRFSGRTAPPHPGGIPHLPDAVTREAYSHEVSSAGFWPGGAGEAASGAEAFFYSYAYPAPAGFADAPIMPKEAHFEPALGEFVLPYEAVRSATDPDAALLDFLDSSYAAAAKLGGWERTALECARGQPRIPRQV